MGCVMFPGYMEHPILLVSANQQGAAPTTRICGEIRVAKDGGIKEYLKARTVYSGHGAIREWVETGVGLTVSRTKFLRCLENRAAQAEHGFEHARGSSKSSSFGTFYGLRLRTPMVRPLLFLTIIVSTRRVVLFGHFRQATGHEWHFEGRIGKEA